MPHSRWTNCRSSICAICIQNWCPASACECCCDVPSVVNGNAAAATFSVSGGGSERYG
ncbi:hypothetical protein B0T16DRAFT_395694 [Cercophora newfieldiana]|uniref:Uncharacterized protein n=1 Tax=Cercophora newfieldiana TaxID=92897 RepID=A0AA40CY33_9PEZI|nr:hypothetical protein B0T16DRAFT_395694 [Cercophora newfieldiana]